MSTDSTVSGLDISEMTNTLFELTDGLVFFLDKECNIIVANSAVLKRTGYNLEELIGKKFFDLFSSNFQIIKEKFCSNNLKNSCITQEIEFLNKDKSTFFAESVNYLVLDDNGELEYIISKNRDITEQKLAERTLQTSETRFRELFDNMSSGVAIYEAIKNGEDYICKDFNKAGEQINQLNKEEVIGKKVSEIFPAVKDFGLFDVFKRVWKTGKSESLPVSLYEDDQITSWRDNYVFKLPSGEIVAVYDDVTERKLAEVYLKENVDKARLVFDSINDGMLIYSLSEKKFIEVNKTICDRLGYNMDELLQKSPIEINSDEYRETVLQKFSQLKLGEGSTFETMHLTKDGQLIPTELSYKNVIIQNDPSMLIIARDVSIRKKVQEELQRSKHYLGERVKEITSLYSISNLLTKTHLSYDQIFPPILTIIPLGWQYAENTMVRINYKGEEYTLPGFEVTPWKQSTEFIIDGEKLGEIEVYYRDEKPEENEGPFMKEERDLLNAISQEITKFINRKSAEEALQQNEELINSIIDNSPIGYALEDIEGNLLRSNPALIQMLGYSHDELKEKKLENLTHPEDKEISNKTIQKVINKKIPVADIEKKYIKKDGSVVPVRLTVWEIFNIEDKPHYFIGTVEDITEQLQNRERIKELNESLRIINDILRHDIGNNIAIIGGAIDAFFDVREDAFLEMTKHAIDKSFDLIKKMEDLEGLLVENKSLEEIDVRKIVEKVIVDYPVASVSIKIEGNGVIIADNAISSVIDNLIGNAIKHGKADEIVVSINPGENHCMIEVADNGKGIPEKYKNMLFRQGFKYGETAGSGLGLYIVKKTLERYGGDVIIKDKVPKGSIFQLMIKTPTT